MTDRTTGARPSRNPMVWLMIGLPLAAVVAGTATLVIAIRSGGSDAIPEEVRRTAQIQTAELGADEAAAQRRLSAVFSVDDGRVSVLVATGDFDRTKPLTLLLQHPIEAAQDISVTLQPDARGWSAGQALDASHDWRLRLDDADAAWRLRGRLPAGQRGTLLRPSLAKDDAAETPLAK